MHQGDSIKETTIVDDPTSQNNPFIYEPIFDHEDQSIPQFQPFFEGNQSIPPNSTGRYQPNYDIEDDLQIHKDGKSLTLIELTSQTIVKAGKKIEESARPLLKEIEIIAFPIYDKCLQTTSIAFGEVNKATQPIFNHLNTTTETLSDQIGEIVNPIFDTWSEFTHPIMDNIEQSLNSFSNSAISFFQIIFQE
jgi:hypothetical protein